MERIADKRIDLKRKLKSTEMSRRRIQGLILNSKVDIGKAHERRRRAEQEVALLKKEIDAERHLNTKLKADCKEISTQLEVERE